MVDDDIDGTADEETRLGDVLFEYDELSDEDENDGNDFNNVADLDISLFKPMFEDEGTILILLMGPGGSIVTCRVKICKIILKN